MRLFTKSLSAGVKCPMRILLLASLFFLSPVLHTHAFGATAAPAVVNDQYKFTQISSTPFVYDQFSGFDYTGYQLHRVYVHTVNETDYVKRIFGNAAYPAGIHAPAGIYNNNFCTGPTSGGAPPPGFFVSGYNAYEFDSWVGIGLSYWPDEFIGEENVVIDSTGLNPWSDNFVLESMSSGNYGPVDIYLDDADTEGGWYLNSDDALNGYAGDDYKAIVMQLMTDSAFTWTLNAEIWIDGDPNNAVIVTQTYNGTSLGSPVIEGCTDVTACNYYDLANTDNGSCDYPDPYYDCDDVCLNDTDGDGVCNELEIEGCTEPLACNYNAAATEEDSSCVFAEGCETCSGATDGTGTVVDNDADDDGVCNDDEIVGCQTPEACNYNSAATDPGTCLFVDGICETCSGETNGTGTVVDNDSDDDGVCNADEVVGCQDSTACNYDIDATDAGSCIYATGCDFCSGATDGTGTVQIGDTDGDGVCDVDEIAGCQDVTACNYDALATDSDGSCDFCSCGQLTGLSPYSLTVEEHAVDGIPGHTTYRLYVNMDHPNDYLNSIYGESPGSVSEPFVLTSTSTPNWYQNDSAGSNLGWEVLPITLNYIPELAYDSWMTIGLEFGPWNDFYTVAGSIGSGFWPAFNAGEDINITSASGFSIYNSPNCDLPPGEPVGSCNPNHPAVAGDDGRVLVGQITTTGTLSGEFSVSILQNGNYGSGIFHTEHFQFNGVGTFSADSWNGAMSSNYQDCGCTDATALNYDDEALYDDGDCIPAISGCMDETACNYMDTATVDSGACVFPTGCESCTGETDGTGTVVDNDSDDDEVCDANEVVGCQDSTACNYNLAATDAGDCEFATGPCDVCSGENDGTGSVIDNDADDDGVCNADEVVGCQDPAACNYNAAATDSGSCVIPTGCETCSGETDGTGTVVGNDSDGDGVCNADEVVGCQDPVACNYNVSATDSAACTYVDGVCETCSGETDGTGTIVDNDSDNDSVCDADEITGCQDAAACNYNENATDAGDCLFATGCDYCSGAVDGSGTVVVGDTDGDSVCDVDEVPGCQDAAACNYNSAATDDNASCVYASGCDECAGTADDGTGYVNDLDVDNDGVCDIDEVAGCQDAAACNFNWLATDSDDSCVYASGCETCSGEIDGTGTVVANDDDGDGVCNADEIVGCQDSTACNYNALATDAGTCAFPEGCDTCSGETDGTGVVIDNDADNDGTCDANEIVGCQNESACNYDPTATDPGECFIAAPYYDCYGECLNDFDGDGICDPVEDMLFDATFEGYQDGYLDGIGDCTGGPDYCGEGTVWSPDFQMCVEDSACPGDLDGDAVVGTNDLLLLLMDYGFACD
jgi:hypothetical protein